MGTFCYKAAKTHRKRLILLVNLPNFLKMIKVIYLV